jgi:hypothetical protein
MKVDSVAMFNNRLGGWATRVTARGDRLSYWVPPMPRIHDAYLDCVLYLYASEADAEVGAKSGGSGFLVGIKTTDLPRDFVFLYAVTNKHVIEGGSTVLRMKTKDGINAIFPTDERGWSVHQDGDDLAACLLSFDPRAFRFSYVWRTDFIDEAIIGGMKIGPGDDVFVVGRFINHEGRQQNLPTARFGCVAQMPSEPIKQDTAFEQESFLVEARSIGGYSGSPVFVYIPVASQREGVEDWVSAFKVLQSHGPWLLGVDWGYINDWEPVRDATGQPVNPANPKATQVRMNTGMMAVVPAWKLAKLLDEGSLAEERKMLIEQARKDMEANPPPATSD